MKRAHRTVEGLRLGVLCVLADVATGCAADARSDRMVCAVCEEPDRFVRIQPAPVEELLSERRVLAHPLRLSEKEWEALLRSIHVQGLRRPLFAPLDKGPVEAGFHDDEAKYLSETLARACAEVTPEEWVIFALRRASQAGLAEFTSGAWYVVGARVHLRLANYRVTVTLPGLQKAIWENPTRPQGDVFYELVPGEHQRLVSQPYTSPFGSTSPDLAIDYAALTRKYSPAPGMTSPTEEEHAAPSSSGSIEERLNTLKRLREQGLITEEDYRAKKRQILDRL